MMKKDLEGFDDIKILVDRFYDKAIQDKTIGFIFTEVMEMDLEDHLPVIYSFWDSVLFGTATYRGNVMLKHIALNEKTALKKEHFEEWLALWMETVDELFEGNKAEEVKTKALNMKRLMEFKIDQSGKPTFIQ